MELYGIIDARGFGREVMPVARQMLSSRKVDYELTFVVENLERETVTNGHRVISYDDFVNSKGKKYFNIAITNSRERERIARKTIDASVQPFSITALNSIVLDDNEIGEGAIICPFTTVTSNAKIGRFFHANMYSYVSHDCVIGDFVSFAPSVRCNGHVIVEDYAYIGTGAIIRPGNNEPLIIGKGAIVGMGAVVTKNVRPFTTVAGCPAVELEKKANRLP